MYSMTGFGKAELKTKQGQYSVEISSVNNRFLEISPKLPRPFFGFEPKLRDLINKSITRGKVYLYIGFEEPDDKSGRYGVNPSIAKAYHKSLTATKKALKLGGEIEIRDLLLLPDIANQTKMKINEKSVWTDLEKVVGKAISDLRAMRKREGSALSKDMRQRLKLIEALVKKIGHEASDCVKAYRDRLTKKISELTINGPVDPNRIEEEIVLVAERTDITEECTRLSSHISQFQKAIRSKESIGKRLNFILQEMNREANTIASKCSDIRISEEVISLKEEVEKLREQVQNVE